MLLWAEEERGFKGPVKIAARMFFEPPPAERRVVFVAESVRGDGARNIRNFALDGLKEHVFSVARYFGHGTAATKCFVRQDVIIFGGVVLLQDGSSRGLSVRREKLPIVLGAGKNSRRIQAGKSFVHMSASLTRNEGAHMFLIGLLGSGRLNMTLARTAVELSLPTKRMVFAIDATGCIKGEKRKEHLDGFVPFVEKHERL